MGGQAFKPAQFIVELWPGGRVAIRQIKTANGDAADFCFDIAAVTVLGVARQDAPHLFGLGASGQDGDSVPALLSMPEGVIAGALYSFRRELFLWCFQLLETDHVGSGLV